MDTNNLENFEFGALDALSIFSATIQILSYIQNLKQTSNDDLLKELRFQDNELLGRIMAKQDDIVERLKKIENLLELKG